MQIPAPFQSTVSQLQNDGFIIQDGFWSDAKTKRNFILRLTGKKAWHGYQMHSYACKMAQVDRVDKDDLYPLQNYRRAIWFQDVLTHLQASGHPLPFSTPYIFQTNAKGEFEKSGVVWMIMDDVARPQICPDLPEKNSDTNRQKICFQELCIAMAACHDALEKITLDAVSTLPEFLPHQSLGLKGIAYLKAAKMPGLRSIMERRICRLEVRRRRQIHQHKEEYTLDMGAFERKNFYLPREGSGKIAQIIDCEFATFSPKHTALAKAFIRLWANDQRPDLARQLLKAYVDRYLPTSKWEDFFSVLTKRLLPKTYSGAIFDVVDRGHLSPTYTGHKLRRQLRYILKHKQWGELLAK